ncbi:MAG: hypothetical protein K2Y07_02215 [Nitrosomonas sp.]|nr:hypothetical protein [Nitrosomonas sp.]OQW84482.1 MAG: hypothetical protein BVN30_03500 [Proteobacteria bacterium ST_bin16]
MASITIRDLPDKTKELLRMRAAKAGISLEAYVRHILQKASLANEFTSADIAQIAEKYFGQEHEAALDLPKRCTKRQAVDFDA